MWGNLSGVVGKALEQVQKISNEFENQMDEAVGRDALTAGSNDHALIKDSDSHEKEFDEDDVIDKLNAAHEEYINKLIIKHKNEMMKLETKLKQLEIKQAQSTSPTHDHTHHLNHNDKTDEAIKMLSLEHHEEINKINDNYKNNIHRLEDKIKSMEIDHMNQLNVIQLKSDEEIDRMKLKSKENLSIINEKDIIIKKLKGNELELLDKASNYEITIANNEKKYQLLMNESSTSIQSLKKELLTKTTSYDELVITSNNNLNKIRHEYDSKILSLQSQLAAYSNDNEKSNNSDSNSSNSSFQQQKIDELYNMITSKDDELNRLQDVYSKKIHALNSTIHENEIQINSLNETVISKDEEISKQLSEYKTMIAKKNLELNDEHDIYHHKIEALNSEINQYQEKISELKHEESNKDNIIQTKIHEYNQMINQKDNEIIELNNTHKLQITTMKAEMEQISIDRQNVMKSRKEEEYNLMKNSLELQIIEINDKYHHEMNELNSKIAILIETESKMKIDYETQLNVMRDSIKSNDIEEYYQHTIEENNNTIKLKDLKIQEIIEKNNELIKSASSLTSDIIKLKEIITDRERALETATQNLTELHKNNQISLQKIADLMNEISEKDMKIRQIQVNAVEEEENKKQLVKNSDIIKELTERLHAFEKEGQNLSKKQSDMEKVIRQSKVDLKNKDNEIIKLKESKEQLVKAIEQTQEVLKKHENDSMNSSKNLTAMQAVSQASTDKLMKLEAEINTKNEEFASQRRALENTWNEINELKRIIAELKAERDDLRKRIGEGTSKVMETESSRRDIEQREAVLRATNKQLQDSLQRQMQESSQREDRLHNELNAMRQRWQEAISGREAMASELGQATAPLLRQISALQDSIRLKNEQWQNLESSLSERALRAENSFELAEHKRLLIEEKLVTISSSYNMINSKVSEYQNQLQNNEVIIERLKKREMGWNEEKSEIDSKYAMEVAQKHSLQSSLREIEIRHQIEVHEISEKHSIEMNQKDLEISKLSKDLDSITTELLSIKSNDLSSSPSLKMLKKNSGNRLKSLISSTSSSSSSSSASENIHHSNSNHNYDDDNSKHLMTESLPNGEMSFVANEKSMQRSRHREDDLQALNLQIQQINASRNALLEEVSYLSMRNSQLEESCRIMPQIKIDLEQYKKQADVLLLMLGEKEEELEGLISDMKEVKYLYSHQIEELLERINPPSVIALQPSIALNDDYDDNNNGHGIDGIGGGKYSDASSSSSRGSQALNISSGINRSGKSILAE